MKELTWMGVWGYLTCHVCDPASNPESATELGEVQVLYYFLFSLCLNEKVAKECLNCTCKVLTPHK